MIRPIIRSSFSSPISGVSGREPCEEPRQSLQDPRTRGVGGCWGTGTEDFRTWQDESWATWVFGTVHEQTCSIHVPLCSMYGIFINIGPKNHTNVGKYTIHGAYGIHMKRFMTAFDKMWLPFCWASWAVNKRKSWVSCLREAILGSNPKLTLKNIGCLEFWCNNSVWAGDSSTSHVAGTQDSCHHLRHDLSLHLRHSLGPGGDSEPVAGAYPAGSGQFDGLCRTGWERNWVSSSLGCVCLGNGVPKFGSESDDYRNQMQPWIGPEQIASVWRNDSSSLFGGSALESRSRPRKSTHLVWLRCSSSLFPCASRTCRIPRSLRSWSCGVAS